MNEYQLLSAVGAAKTEYLTESEEKSKKRLRPWAKWAALAASACLIVGLGAGARLLFGGSKTETAPGESNSGSAQRYGGVVSTEGGKSAADTQESTFMAYQGPIFPLTLLESAPEITASRRIDMDFAPYTPVEVTQEETLYGDARTYTTRTRSLDVTDSYTLRNASSRNVTVTALYPFASSLRDLSAISLTLDDGAVEPKLYMGSYSGDFAPAASPDAESGERWNLDHFTSWADYQRLLSDGTYQKNAFSALPALDQTVYVYTLETTGEPMESPATIAMTPEYDSEKTKILTWSFNGFGHDEETGEEQYSYFVSHRSTVCLAALGDDLTGYTVQGYENGGCQADEKLDTLSADVARTEMTLADFLRFVTREALENYTYYDNDEHARPDEAVFELFYRTAVEFLTEYGYLSDDPAERYSAWGGSLDNMISDALVTDRVFYAAVEVTIPAGESVTLAARQEKSHSYDYYGAGSGREALDGYDLVTRLGSVLTFTGQTAHVETRGLVEIVEQNFGFDVENGITTVTLDPEIEHYYMNVAVLEPEK